MRVTVDIATFDPEVLRRALKAMNVGFNEVAGSFHVEGGVTVDMTAGLVTVDTDAGRALADSIQQRYAEQAFLMEAERQGVSVVARERSRNGDIVIRCQSS
jgi:uncharacterized protein (AIM24 family)